jgi:hypothetical protein
MGNAIAMARFVPCSPPPPPVLPDGGAGPAIRVSLKIALMSGKKGSPGTGGWRHSMCSACMTRYISMRASAQEFELTIRYEDLFWDQTVAECAIVDLQVAKSPSIAEINARICIFGIIGDLVGHRVVQRLAGDLTWTRNRDALNRDAEHA